MNVTQTSSSFVHSRLSLPDPCEKVFCLRELVIGKSPIKLIRHIPRALCTAEEHAGENSLQHPCSLVLVSQKGFMALSQYPRGLEFPIFKIFEFDRFNGKRAAYNLTSTTKFLVVDRVKRTSNFLANLDDLRNGDSVAANSANLGPLAVVVDCFGNDCGKIFGRGQSHDGVVAIDDNCTPVLEVEHGV